MEPTTVFGLCGQRAIVCLLLLARQTQILACENSHTR